MKSRTATIALFFAILGLFGIRAPRCAADVLHSHDDGTAELAVGIDPGEDALNFSRFTAAAQGEIITSISVAYGRPGSTSPLNGLSVSILLYEDADGGSPFNAVLKTSVNAVVLNANTNTFKVYALPPTEVHGTFLAAILFRNTTSVNRFIGALDTTPPHTSDASFYSWAVGLDETNLSTIPSGQYGTMESLGFSGNWLIRANGTPIPEPASLWSALGAAALLARRRQRSR